jgi:hypothetical protein
MEHLLYQYHLNPTTWVYLASLLIITIYFKFSRLFSVRNIDLIGLILLAPGTLLVAQGRALALSDAARGEMVGQLGYVWLFAVGLFFLVRLLGDPMMVRRPLLEPNLSPGGMAFLGGALLVFLLSNVVTTPLSASDLDGPRRLDDLLSRREGELNQSSLASHGPGYPLLHLLPSIPSKIWAQGQGQSDAADSADVNFQAWVATARTTAVLSHLAVVLGLILIGYRHFDNIKTGVAVALLYLLLPYTAQTTGHIDHVLPAALLVWAIEAYRRPWLAGMLLGLAAGAIYYPLFLLPLWTAFYWQRGLLRFSLGFLSMLALLVLTLALGSSSLDSFLAQTKLMFGWTSLSLENVDGFWDVGKAAYRIPVVAMFAVICVGMAIWPARKNLGTLLSCSAAIMLGTQFWHAHGGGLYMGWYLPLLLLTVFRPNLEDRVALSVLGESWLEQRVTHLKRPRIRAA